MSNTKRLQTGVIKLTEAQHYFLRTRYGYRRNVGANTLVRQAVLEIVGIQAKKELDETGYHVGKDKTQGE